MDLDTKLDTLLERLEVLQADVIEYYDEFTLLDAEFRQKKTQVYYQKFRPTSDSQTLALQSKLSQKKPALPISSAEAKAAAEFDLTLDPRYPRFLQLPNLMEKCYRLIKILELQLQAITQKIALQRQNR